jgi:tetratricopeptide (TPR) repeat protein
MNAKALRGFSIGLMVIILAVGLIFSQAGRGTARLSGVVTDQNGMPLEGAQITLSYTQGTGGAKRETKTDKKGEWSFMGLGTGRWELTVVMKGYEPSTQSLLVSQLALNAKAEVKMKKAAPATSGGEVIQDESSFIFLDLGNQLYKEGKYEEAIAQYNLFLEKNPQAYQVRLNVADAHREKGELDKAAELYNKLIELSAGDPTLGKDVAGKALAGIGNIFLKQNKVAEAQEYFRKSLERSPKDEILAYNVGEIYFSNQNLDEAQKYFELATQIKPEWPDPYLKMGYVYLNKADNVSAVKMFEKFLTLEPEGERAALAQNILKTIKK